METTGTYGLLKQRPSEQWAEMLGPCARCGKLMADEMTDEEAQLQMEIHFSPASNEIQTKLLKLYYGRLVCRDCCRWAEYRTADRQRRSVLDACYRANYLRPESRHVTFQKSLAEVEARNPTAWSTVRHWHIDLKNLWIQGPPGSGKTFMARCLLNYFAGCTSDTHSQDKRVLAGEISATEFKCQAERFDKRERLKYLREIHLALFDDLDKPLWSPGSLDELRDTLGSLRDRKCRVVVTTNMTISELQQRLTRMHPYNTTLVEAVFERLAPMTVIELRSAHPEQSEIGEHDATSF